MLVFLNSGILALAIATIIPILIYLFVIKKPRKVLFSTIKYIKASQKRQKSKIKLKNILLLIIRCLIILLAILALARPAIRTPLLHRWSRHSQAAVAIILDTSYSMDYLVDTRTDLEIGKDMIKEINDILTDKDIAYLFTSDQQWNRIYSSQSFDEIPDHLLATINITHQPLPMDEMISQATNRLLESHILNREIYVITDFRDQNYPDDNEIPVLLLPTSSFEDKLNISVQNVSIEEDYVQRRFERNINFEVVNHSAISQQDVICQLYVNGRTITEKVTDVQPKQRKVESFSLKSENPGWYYGYVSVRNERLPFDNRNYFSFYNPENVKVAVISNQNTMPITLMSILEIYVRDADNIDIITDDNLNYERLSDYQFIIVDTKRQLSPRLKFSLEKLIENNIGVLHITGQDIDLSWKEYYSEKFRLELSSYQDNVPRRISYANTHHPIMAIFDDETDEPIEINSYWLSRNRGPANILLQTDNIPIVLENDREVLWLFDIHDIRNRILLDPIFPVMAYRTFLFCSYNDNPSYVVGDRIMLPQNRITKPNRETIETNEPNYVFSSNGIFEIPVTDTFSKYVPVNIDYSPSEYQRIAEIDTESLATLGEDWHNDILRSRYGVEIWKYLLALALILVGLEMFIVKKEEKTNNMQ